VWYNADHTTKWGNNATNPFDNILVSIPVLCMAFMDGFLH